MIRLATQTKSKRDGSTMPRNFARNRGQAQRNADIYNAVVVKGERQEDVGQRFGLTQCTVSCIVNNPNSATYR